MVKVRISSSKGVRVEDPCWGGRKLPASQGQRGIVRKVGQVQLRTFQSVF